MIAGFEILRYIGFRRYGTQGKGYHWYMVKCLECSRAYERYQGSLTRAVSKGTKGCHKCAKKRHAEDMKKSEMRSEWAIMQSLWLWSWVYFQMPVTSLRERDERGRSFDSEKTKAMGWRTI